MAQHNDFGKLGEQLAQKHLMEQGFSILEVNYRMGKLEADIVAYKKGLVVFAEVKTRRSVDFGEPEDFVTPQKQRAYIRLADNYMIEHDRDEEVRFDILSVVMNATGYQINHIENAFSAYNLGD